MILTGLLGLGFLSTRLAEWLRLPHSVLLVLLGLAGGQILNNDHLALELFPELVLYVLLPPLIFESAYHLDFDGLRRDFFPVAGLAVLGLLLSTGLIGMGLHWIGLPLQEALVFGALISATDPVAVVALFRKIGAPHRLSLLVEGESLLNDGTAIVLFRVLLVGASSLASAASSFLVVTLGGVVVGLVLILVSRLFFHVTRKSGVAQVGLTVVAAYSSFIIADHWVGASGVISTMVVGLYLGRQARLHLNRESLMAMQSIWELLALSANTLIFLAVGLNADLTGLIQSPKLALTALALVFLARCVAVFSISGICNKLKLAQRISYRYQSVMFWGGLRGGLALALALIVPITYVWRGEILVLTTAVVLTYLLLNALTTGPLIRLLKLDRLTQAEEAFYTRTLEHVLQSVFEGLSPAVERGALSGRLLREVREQSMAHLQDHDVGTERFGIYRMLLDELQQYNRQLEHALLSTRTYHALSQTVEARLELYDESGLEALQEYELQRIRATREVDSLADELEFWLHMDFALADPTLPLSPQARELREHWSAQTAERLQQFYAAYPNLGLGVQTLFLARTVSASAENSLEELLHAGVIGTPVYAKATASLAELHQELLEESQKRINISFRNLLLGVPLFEGLPANLVDLVEKEAVYHRLVAGEAAFQKGDPANSLFLLLSGVLEVRVEKEGGCPRLFPGSFFGELGLLYGRPRSARVVALVDSEVAELRRDVLDQLIEHRPQIRERLEVEAQTRLRTEAAPR